MTLANVEREEEADARRRRWGIHDRRWRIHRRRHIGRIRMPFSPTLCTPFAPILCTPFPPTLCALCTPFAPALCTPFALLAERRPHAYPAQHRSAGECQHERADH